MSKNSSSKPKKSPVKPRVRSISTQVNLLNQSKMQRKRKRGQSSVESTHNLVVLSLDYTACLSLLICLGNNYLTTSYRFPIYINPKLIASQTSATLVATKHILANYRTLYAFTNSNSTWFNYKLQCLVSCLHRS